MLATSAKNLKREVMEKNKFVIQNWCGKLLRVHAPNYGLFPQNAISVVL